MDILIELEECQKKVNELTIDHNDLLIRIVGVSDVILLEQLTEEYKNITESLQLAECNLANLNKRYLDYLINVWVNENKIFYRMHYVVDTPLNCLEKINNVELKNKINEQRMRLPITLQQRRELCIIANFLDIKIKLLDLEKNNIDTIGKLGNKTELYLYSDYDNRNTCYPR